MTTNTAVKNVRVKSKDKKRGESEWAEVWRRLKKNRMAMVGLTILILLVLMAIFADVLAPAGYNAQNVRLKSKAPSSEFWMGTDNFGRSILDRAIHGSRVSLTIGIISVSIAVLFGGLLGALAGFFGGKLDNIIMRLMDILLAIPSILLAISIVAALGGGLFNVMIAVGISSIPGYARIVRASVMSLKGQEFVDAARAIGAGNSRIIFKHIIPNSLAPVIVQGTLGVATAILSAAGLSFIGLGLQPPTPEWGAMLAVGRHHVRDHGHMTLYPGLFIMITILALNLLGDGLRDALDPKLKSG